MITEIFTIVLTYSDTEFSKSLTYIVGSIGAMFMYLCPMYVRTPGNGYL